SHSDTLTRALIETAIRSGLPMARILRTFVRHRNDGRDLCRAAPGSRGQSAWQMRSPDKAAKCFARVRAPVAFSIRLCLSTKSIGPLITIWSFLGRQRVGATYTKNRWAAEA